MSIENKTFLLVKQCQKHELEQAAESFERLANTVEAEEPKAASALIGKGVRVCLEILRKRAEILQDEIKELEKLKS